MPRWTVKVERKWKEHQNFTFCERENQRTFFENKIICDSKFVHKEINNANHFISMYTICTLCEEAQYKLIHNTYILVKWKESEKKNVIKRLVHRSSSTHTYFVFGSSFIGNSLLFIFFFTTCILLIVNILVITHMFGIWKCWKHREFLHHNRSTRSNWRRVLC